MHLEHAVTAPVVVRRLPVLRLLWLKLRRRRDVCGCGRLLIHAICEGYSAACGFQRGTCRRHDKAVWVGCEALWACLSSAC